MAADLRGEFDVIRQIPLQAQVRLGDLQYMVAVEAEPPHRLAGLRALPLGGKVRDHREPARPRTRGEVPAEVPAIAAAALADLGLPALLLAGAPASDRPATGRPGQPGALGPRPGLGRPGPGRAPGPRPPVPGARRHRAGHHHRRAPAGRRRPRSAWTARSTTTSARCAWPTTPSRCAKCSPTPPGWTIPRPSLYADTVPDLASVMGPVIGCPGPRGAVRPSNGGIAVLGQLVADVTGQPYAEAATGLVLDPLGLRDSSFPDRPASVPAPARSPATPSPCEGMFQPVPARIPALQAVGRAVVDGGRSRAPGARVVIAAARVPRARGAHPAGRTRPTRERPHRPRLAHPPDGDVAIAAGAATTPPPTWPSAAATSAPTWC